MKNFITDYFGKWMIIIGIAGFLASVVISFTSYAGVDHGALPAVSFLISMIGIAFQFPSLLEESPGQLSTMRIVVFIITLVFASIYVKIGWNAGTFEQFTIDRTWVYILGLAFGSKAFQKFGEDKSDDKPKRE
ncbi:MAG: hypothetical protein WA057_05995 [Candidatus Magasanikiibacteriota bacterium]